MFKQHHWIHEAYVLYGRIWMFGKWVWQHCSRPFAVKKTKKLCPFEDVPLVEFTCLVFTRTPGESYCRRLRSLLLYLCYVYRALINSLVCKKQKQNKKTEHIYDTPPKWSCCNLLLKEQTNTTFLCDFVVCLLHLHIDSGTDPRSSIYHIWQNEIFCWKERVGSRETPRLRTVLGKYLVGI